MSNEKKITGGTEVHIEGDATVILLTKKDRRRINRAIALSGFVILYSALTVFYIILGKLWAIFSPIFR